jgi:RHS repeat-associated protein
LYDELGRKCKTTFTKGTVKNIVGTEFNYTTGTAWANNNTGKVNKEAFVKPNGNVHTTVYTYDAFGRTTSTLETIADNATSSTSYTTQYQYDVYNKMIRKVYPSGLAVKQIYDPAAGVLASVTNDAGTIKYFEAGDFTPNGFVNYRLNVNFPSSPAVAQTAMNVARNITKGHETSRIVTKTNNTIPIFYNEITWATNFSNITQRFTDISNTTATGAPVFPSTNAGLTRKAESFTYDNFDRLNTANVYNYTSLDPPLGVGEGLYEKPLGATTATATTAFANNGNITTKAGIGTINYDAAKIYSAVSTENAQGLINTQPQNITYTMYHQPSLIQEVKGTSNWKMTLDYDEGLQRCKSVLTETVGAITTVRDTRYYLGDYEIDLDNRSGTVINRQIHYIQGGDGICAVIVKTNSGAEEVYYPFTDHLGSIIAFANTSSTIVYERSFDAWGRRRNPFTFDYATPDAGIAATSPLKWWYRGYTGHEELPTFALINMNGRLYDPALGRMLSPDGIVHPGSQGINRYSYAFGNPIKYNDPDGHDPIHGAAALIGGLVGGFMNVASNSGNLSMSWSGLGQGAMYFGSGFAGGAAAGLIGVSGGPAAAGAAYGLITGTLNGKIDGMDWGDALKQGATEAAYGYLGGKVAGFIGAGVSKIPAAMKQRAAVYAGNIAKAAISSAVRQFGGIAVY